jgi:hypothetical protein
MDKVTERQRAEKQTDRNSDRQPDGRTDRQASQDTETQRHHDARAQMQMQSKDGQTCPRLSRQPFIFPPRLKDWHGGPNA